MQLRRLWERSAPSVVLLFLVALAGCFGVSLFRFFWYQCFVVGVGLFLLWALTLLLLVTPARPWTRLWSAALVLVVLATAFYSSPTVNFWLTGAARQRMVARLTTSAPVSPAGISYPHWLLGTATVYGAQGPVYFDYYKRGTASFNQAAFFVYTTSPNSLEREHLVQLIQLDEQWFFVVRGYAD